MPPDDHALVPPAEDTGSPTDPAQATAPVRLLPGREVPNTRYRITRWLGEGGMGVVYEVAHLDIERRAALKVLRARMDEAPEMADKFREEARAASTIGAENIVEIYDFGALPDGRLMFTMELLDGHPLVDEIDDAPMPIERLLPILRQTARGLAAAHRAGIVHRDIKPENVMLCRRRDGRSDWVKIVDFGLARFVRSGCVEEQDLAGSPHYMAPELCLGLPFDGRVDLYALGCVAYELLCKEPPFMATSIEEVLRAHVSTAPTPPRARVGAACPEVVEALILKMLAKDPNDRFADAADLEAAICEAQLALGIETPWDDLSLPDVDPDRRERLLALQHDPDAALVGGTLARSRRLFVAGLLAAIVGVGSVVYGRFSDPPSSPGMDRIARLEREATEAAARASYVYPPPGSPDGATAYRAVRKLERLARDEDDEAAAKAARSLRTRFAETLVGLGDRYWELPEGRPFAAEFYTMALLFRPDEPRARERAFVSPAQLAELAHRAESGDFTDAELAAVAFVRPLAEQAPQAAAETLQAQLAEAEAMPPSTRALAQRFVRANAPRVATRDGSAARKAPPRAGGPEPPRPPDGAPEANEPVEAPKKERRDVAGAKAAVEAGRAHLRRGALGKAQAAFDRALALDPRSTGAVVGLADVAFERGRYERAARLLERAARRAPRSGAVFLRLGDAYFRALRYADAEAAYRRAKALGAARAADRLERVRKKLGR